MDDETRKQMNVEETFAALDRIIGKLEKGDGSPELPLATYSRGMGALGLPGDLSSQSRFARVAFTRANSISGDSEEESVSQFFHILGSVDQQRGCCEVAEGKYEITIYTLLQCRDRNLLLYDLRKPPGHRGGYEKRSA